MKAFLVSVPTLTLATFGRGFGAWFLGLFQSAGQALRCWVSDNFTDIARAVGDVARVESYYHVRAPGLTLTKRGPHLRWVGCCPMCERHTFMVVPLTGQWTCEGPCSNTGTPESLEYLIDGEGSEERAALLMGAYPPDRSA
jgi:hypothetical protein